jgi:amino-acid N-acetyltransferase
MDTTDYAKWFRGSTPYISAHRGKTFVILLGSNALAHPNLTNVVHDLALLHVLGVRLVLVHGARSLLEDALPTSAFHKHRRITDGNAMNEVIAVNGRVRAQLEALFSTGLPNTPLHNVDVAVVSGNFVTAKPVGVIDGVDHLFTGQVRRIETARIARALDTGALVMQAPIGYSPSGQAFNLAADELAAELSVQLKADKLIAFDEIGHLTDGAGRVSSLTPTELDRHPMEVSEETRSHLSALARAVRGGVGKGHLVSYPDDGALLAELFTAAGVGTQISEKARKPVRPARSEDVAGIVEVIRPLEESGALVRRSRDRLEQEVDRFLVAELDGIVVGCCAVYPFDGQAELACIAVHENYRGRDNARGIGQSLLAAAEEAARAQGLANLFALTTQTRDWFLDHGFADADINVLPDEKQSLYNWQRNSKVVTKNL